MQNENIISLNQFVNDADKMVNILKTTNRPFILTKDDAAVAVIQDINQYRKLLNALQLLKLTAQGEKDIQNGKKAEQAQVFEELNSLLESMSE